MLVAGLVQVDLQLWGLCVGCHRKLPNREEVAWVETGPLSTHSGIRWRGGFRKNAPCTNKIGVLE